MQEEVLCAGDVLTEIESAELLEVKIDNEIKTLWAECGNFTFAIC